MTGNWIRWGSKEKGVWKMERYRINNEGKNQAKNQMDGSSKERYGKEREEMDAGETRQGMERQGHVEISL
jgi:hypothetical protein